MFELRNLFTSLAAGVPIWQLPGYLSNSKLFCRCENAQRSARNSRSICQDIGLRNLKTIYSEEGWRNLFTSLAAGVPRWQLPGNLSTSGWSCRCENARGSARNSSPICQSFDSETRNRVLSLSSSALLHTSTDSMPCYVDISIGKKKHTQVALSS